MPTRRSKPPSTQHRGLKRQAIVRLEINARSDDAGLIRSVVKALNDRHQRSAVRNLLQKRFGGSPSKGLKAMLAAAPLDGIDLSRDRDVERAIKL